MKALDVRCEWIQGHDEPACWQRAQPTWDLVMLALRAGGNPQAMITTTPRRVAVLKRILAEATTVQTKDTTYANQAHLPPDFLTQRWPHHPVLDGLDTIELLLDAGCLLIHPRCVRLKEAFANYCRQRRGGEWIDFPADGHPEEDMIDALRGGIRDALPDGGVIKAGLPQVHASRML